MPMRREITLSLRLGVFLWVLSALLLPALRSDAAEPMDFHRELSTLPLAASSLSDLDEELVALRKFLPEHLRMDQKLEAFLDARVAELSASLESVTEQRDTPDEEQHAETLKSLISYYRNYQSAVKGLTEDSPSPARSSPPYTVEVYDTLRLAIHKTFTDIQGDYIMALQYKALCAQGQRELEEARAREGRSPSREGRLSLELQEIDFALDVLNLQMCADDLHRGFAHLERQKEELAEIHRGIKFSESELEGILKELSLEETRRQDKEKILYAQHQRAESIYLREKESFKDIDAKDILPLAGNSARHSQLARRYVEYVCYRTWYDIHKMALSELQGEKELWQARFDFYNDRMSDSQLRQTREKLGKWIEGVNVLQERRQFLFQTNFSMTLQGLKSKRDRASDEIRENLDGGVRALEALVAEFSRNYSAQQQQYLLALHTFNEELGERVGSFEFIHQTKEFGLRMAGAVWNAVLWDAEGYAITVRKLTGAFCILLVGFWISLRFSRFFERRMRAGSSDSETSAILLRYAIFYSLLCAFIVIALKTVRIPLTAFAFIGGAVGVGLGFGMQNIFANLVSGIIIMAHRPFKLRDIVETGEHKGEISEISSRATVLRCFDEGELVIPNRHFLENGFVNWTRKNPQQRLSILILTSLDADPDEVERLILEIAKGEEKITRDPKPFIAMKDFNYIGYQFSLYFWLDIVEHNAVIVSGRLRSRIVHELRARNWLCRMSLPAEVRRD